jgi:ABC-2 type transport system permease protein
VLAPLGLTWIALVLTPNAGAGTASGLVIVLGSLVTAIADSNNDNPQIQAILQSLGHTDSSEIGRTLIIAIFVIVAALAAAAGVQSVLRMREEEADGRLEPVLATPRSRVAWLLSWTFVAPVIVVVVLVATGATAALSFAALDDTDHAWLSLGSAVAAAPAALTSVGITALLFGLLPRLAIALGWGVYGVTAGIGMFGNLLGLDQDVIEKISPIANVPALPTDDWVPTLVLSAIVVLAVALAALGFRRRDLAT